MLDGDKLYIRNDAEGSTSVKFFFLANIYSEGGILFPGKILAMNQGLKYYNGSIIILFNLNSSLPSCNGCTVME